MIDPTTALAFSIYENRGVFALLLGSGVSRAAQIPTGWEIILDLAKRIGTLEGIADQPDWAAWYRKRFNAEPNYSALLDTLSRTPDERRSILHHYIEPTPEDLQEGRKIPTRAHHAIAQLVRDGFVRVILTTNFDRLTENALREEGVEPTVIRSDDDLAGAVPLIHSRCYLIKVHGDYLDTRIRNTDEELGSYSEPLNVLLDRVLDEHGLIVCGWSGDWDHALREALTRAPNRRYPFYWASRGTPSTIANDLISHRRGIVASIADADTFFDSLQRRVESQSALQRENPGSLALLVATAKKYLAKPEFRIQLHDLAMEETRRLQQLLANSTLAADVQWSPEEFRLRVARLRAAAEPLVRLFALFGRWGGDAELDLCAEILKSVGKERLASGVVAFTSLRTYPAVLLLYAFGLGAAHANRLSTVFALLSTPIQQESIGQTGYAVTSLFLWDWRGSDDRVWRHLDGFERRYTPLSDHLKETTKELLSDLCISTDDFELLFERFELLCSLAHATLSHSKEDLQQALNSDSGRGYERIPVGCIAWHTESWRLLSAEFAQPDVRKNLLKGGFSSGQDEHFELALKNIARVIGSVRTWR